MHARRQRIADQEPGWRVRSEIPGLLGADHLPHRVPLPQVSCALGPCQCQGQAVIIGNRLQPPGPRITRITAPRRLHIRPEGFGHQQAVELKRFLVIPVFRHMRGQSAHESSAGPGPRAMGIDHLNPRATSGQDPRDAEAENSGSAHGDVGCDFGHCHSGYSSPRSPPSPRYVIMELQTEPLDWRDGDVPVSRRFDDPYFSLDNGLAETRHVFLAGNDLPARFRDGFHIAELGFGTGLNLLAALAAWRAAGIAGRLHFTSFEAYPMPPSDMRRAQSRFAELAPVAADLAPHWQGQAQEITLPDLQFTLITGDARDTLKPWPGTADAWFLDGFSPAKNPELWQPDLMTEVAHHTAPGGTAATYTAAGFVRRGLEAAGFSVTRQAGYGRKRHMTVAAKGKA